MMTKLQEAIEDPMRMDENQFWAIIDFANWKEISIEGGRIDWDAHKNRIIKRFGLNHQDVVELRKYISTAWQLLDQKIGNDRNPARGGDDSHGDLISHIIGLGRDEFYASLEDYSRIDNRGAAKYGSKEGYRECFSYIIPYESEMKKV